MINCQLHTTGTDHLHHIVVLHVRVQVILCGKAMTHNYSLYCAHTQIPFLS